MPVLLQPQARNVAISPEQPSQLGRQVQQIGREIERASDYITNVKQQKQEIEIQNRYQLNSTQAKLDIRRDFAEAQKEFQADPSKITERTNEIIVDRYDELKGDASQIEIEAYEREKQSLQLQYGTKAIDWELQQEVKNASSILQNTGDSFLNVVEGGQILSDEQLEVEIIGEYNAAVDAQTHLGEQDKKQLKEAYRQNAYARYLRANVPQNGIGVYDGLKNGSYDEEITPDQKVALLNASQGVASAEIYDAVYSADDPKAAGQEFIDAGYDFATGHIVKAIDDRNKDAETQQKKSDAVNRYNSGATGQSFSKDEVNMIAEDTGTLQAFESGDVVGASEELEVIVERTGKVPSDLTTRVVDWYKTGDPQQRQAAMLMAENIKVSYPLAFQTSMEKADRTTINQMTYAGNLVKSGVNAQEAISLADKRFSMNPDVVKAIESEGARHLKEQDIDDVLTDNWDTILTLEPGMSEIYGRSKPLQNAYKQLFNAHLLESRDANEAEANALADLNRVAGVHTEQGEKIVMMYAPSALFKQLVPQAETKEVVEYYEQMTKEQFKQIDAYNGLDIDIDKVHIMPDSDTIAGFQEGGVASYTVMIDTPTGLQEVLDNKGNLARFQYSALHFRDERDRQRMQELEEEMKEVKRRREIGEMLEKENVDPFFFADQ